jgi:hypothetical protein
MFFSLAWLVLFMTFSEGEPPKTAFRSRVDGGRSVFGVAGCMAAASVGVLLKLNLSLVMGFGRFRF